MKNNKGNPNKLINRKALRALLKAKNIRAGDDALRKIENILRDYIGELINASKENMIINGRKNLKAEDLNAERQEYVRNV